MQIGVIRRSNAITDADIAFMCKAVSAQVYECAEAWGLPPTPVAFYSKEEGLPDGDVRIMSIVDDDGSSGTIGFHDNWAGTISARVEAMGARTSIIISHEALEMLVNPNVNLWHTMPDGKRMTAREICDACESDTYIEPVSIMGETRGIEVSNYLLPSWFDPFGKFPFDRMSKLTAPFTMDAGGYLIVRDDNRNISNVFASGMPARMARKLANPLSRTMRILAGNRGTT